MDFSLNSDQQLIRDTVRRFMEAEVRPILREFERAHKFPTEQIKKLGEMGYCGMLAPDGKPSIGAIAGVEL
jgi:alkylation response protein AidB-like acyl-CoA dehydrogenase